MVHKNNKNQVQVDLQNPMVNRYKAEANQFPKKVKWQYSHLKWQY